MRVGWIKMMRIEWFDHRSRLRADLRAAICRGHVGPSSPRRVFDRTGIVRARDDNDRNIGLWPVCPAGLQPAASRTQSARPIRCTISGVQLRWAHLCSTTGVSLGIKAKIGAVLFRAHFPRNWFEDAPNIL